jgi:hypothetical protein
MRLTRPAPDATLRGSPRGGEEETMIHPEDDWYLEQTYGVVRRLPPEHLIQYGKAVMLVIGADGEISDAEMRAWMGIARASGVPDEIRDAWRHFDWRSARLEDFVPGISSDPENPGELTLAFLYDAIRVAWVDGYADKERAAVARAARTLGIAQSAVAAIERLVEHEASGRALRVALLYPTLSRFHPGKSLGREQLR